MALITIHHLSIKHYPSLTFSKLLVELCLAASLVFGLYALIMLLMNLVFLSEGKTLQEMLRLSYSAYRDTRPLVEKLKDRFGSDILSFEHFHSFAIISPLYDRWLNPFVVPTFETDRLPVLPSPLHVSVASAR